MERKKHDDQVSGEIETEHPGYLGSQDTFYVGTLKGVRRIYQQTFVYTDLESLQRDLDEWVMYYNEQRTHQGKMCSGRTPLVTLEDGKQIWEEKFVG
uniref:Integrase core domain-containing protein n=4 Tax=Candidatus Kentrum eta TaxID=2126337 RepID=A0A450VUK5_9GAMM|nr:MAG: hypothetical protein BECKH772A_GA0070896_108601 [Candidatus Kentron sp. H]